MARRPKVRAMMAGRMREKYMMDGDMFCCSGFVVGGAFVDA